MLELSVFAACTILGYLIMRRVDLLDYARFLAAVFVVLFHYTFNGIQNGKISSIAHIPGLIEITKYGYLGVEFFFMISGYVIFFSVNQKSAGQFLVSRAVRLFPAFWAALAFTSCVASFWGGAQMSISLSQVLANITMFPDFVGYGFVDGAYWTLQYEWKFYFLVMALLVLGARRQLPVVFVLWPVYIACAQLAGLDRLPYTDGYYSYFAAGALFALRQQQRDTSSLFALLLCAYLCLTFSSGVSVALSAKKGVEFAGEIVGLIVGLFFLFFASLSLRSFANIKLPGAKLAGALTYPVYLVHAHFGYMVISRFANEDNKISIYFITFAAVLTVAYGIHVGVEKRLSVFWKRVFSQTVGRLADHMESGVRVSIMRWRSTF